MRYAIFLRGVNVGGRTVRSADLRRALSEAGLDAVTTYVASGNVTCETDLSATALQAAVEKALSKEFSYDAHVQVFRHAELASIVDGYPFAADDNHHRYAVLCDTPAVAAELGRTAPGDMEEIQASGRTVYWRCPKGSTLDTPFSKATSARAVKDATTTRNLNTLEKML